jgi:sarcosine oxidase subunit gamma
LDFAAQTAPPTFSNVDTVCRTQPNQAVRQHDGSWVARLSQAEYLLLGSLADDGARVAGVEAEWVQDAQRNYPLPRQDSHAWLQLSGGMAAVMAKLWVDLRTGAFPVGAVAQTSVARINMIVLNVGSDERPVLQQLLLIGLRWRMREAVLDAVGEFGGGWSAGCFRRMIFGAWEIEAPRKPYESFFCIDYPETCTIPCTTNSFGTGCIVHRPRNPRRTLCHAGYAQPRPVG